MAYHCQNCRTTLYGCLDTNAVAYCSFCARQIEQQQAENERLSKELAEAQSVCRALAQALEAADAAGGE